MAEQTFFDVAKRSYADVAREPGVDTTQFLEATETVVSMFDLFGSTAFSVVQKDMNGNIKKIRDRQLAAPLKSETLEDLVRNEMAEGKHTATQGLLWLLRGLEFTAAGLRRSVSNASEELSTSFTKAYEGTLKKFHGYLVRPVFSLAMKACPYRKDFFAKLGHDQVAVDRELRRWLAALEELVQSLQAFYTANNYGKGL